MPQDDGSGSEKVHHFAFWLASASVGLSLFGSAVAALVLWRNRGLSAVMAWMAFPILAASAGMLFSLGPWPGPIWACAGALFGFVVFGAWSFGPFYLSAALVLFLAAIVHVAHTGLERGCRSIAPLLWMMAGASGLGAVMRVFAWWQTSETDYHWNTPNGFGYYHASNTPSVAPIVVWASWVFVAACAGIVIIYALSGSAEPNQS